MEGDELDEEELGGSNEFRGDELDEEELGGSNEFRGDELDEEELGGSNEFRGDELDEEELGGSNEFRGDELDEEELDAVEFDTDEFAVSVELGEEMKMMMKLVEAMNLKEMSWMKKSLMKEKNPFLASTNQ